MLAPSISVSQRVSAVSLKAALLYTWLIAHCDDQGRMSANPTLVKAIVLPLRSEIAQREVKELLDELDMNGLIRVYFPQERIDSDYATEEDAILQMLDWWDFQTLRDPRASRFLPMPDWTDHTERHGRDESGRFSDRDE
jgi:hypothetical protein